MAMMGNGSLPFSNAANAFNLSTALYLHCISILVQSSKSTATILLNEISQLLYQ
jgi:hypothetical protein